MNVLRELADVLLRMRMLSEGRSAASFDAIRTPDSEPDYTPTLAGGSLYEEYAGPNGELTRLVYRMERDLRRATHTSRKPEHKEDRDKRIIRDYEGWPAAKVAEWEGMGHQTVRDVRKRNDRDASTGQRKRI